jgi:hypothetical protein
MSSSGNGSGGTKKLAFPHLGFVGGLLFAIRKAGKVTPVEPPEYLKCPITQELFGDPVILSQTGYTYDRPAIERWLRQKTPPTDPSTNVELYTTETVPNWALRDAANEWCTANGAKPLQDPESAKRQLAGGRAALPGRGGEGLRTLLSSTAQLSTALPIYPTATRRVPPSQSDALDCELFAPMFAFDAKYFSGWHGYPPRRQHFCASAVKT